MAQEDVVTGVILLFASQHHHHHHAFCRMLAIFITKVFRIYLKHSKFKHFKGSHFSPAEVIDRILFTQGPNLLIRASWCSVYTPSNVLPPQCTQCITFKPHLMYYSVFSVAITFSYITLSVILCPCASPHSKHTINNSSCTTVLLNLHSTPDENGFMEIVTEPAICD